jgi:hypothetical protein
MFVLSSCSAPPAILLQLCQNRRFSVLTSIEKTEKCRVVGGQQLCYFWSRIPWWKRKCKMSCYRDATASSFVAKVRCEVFANFHAVAVKRHSSMRNWLFDLPGRILYKQSPSCKRKWWACSWLCSSPVSFSRSRLFWTFLKRLMLSSSNACLITVKALSHSFRDVHNIKCRTFCRIYRETASDSKLKDVKINTSNELRKILYTDSHDTPVLSPTVESRYYNCCIDGSISPGNYGHSICLAN